MSNWWQPFIEGRRSGNHLPPTPARPESGSTEPQRLRILIAGVQPHILQMVEVNLQRANITVIAARDSDEVVAKAHSERPDRVILDTSNADFNGFAVLQRLKEDTNTASIPVALLVSKTQDADLLQGWQARADCFLTTPFNPQDLIRFLR